MDIDANEESFVKSLSALNPNELDSLSREMYQALEHMHKLDGSGVDQSDIAASLIRALSTLSGS